MILKRFLSGLMLAAAVVSLRGAAAPELVGVRKIWDAAPHSAFTDLVKFQDRWFCTFREGTGHVTAKAGIRVITSRDGTTWESAALIERAGFDLRDPKLTVHPDGKQLVLLGGATIREDGKPATESQSFTSFSADGRTWSPMNWAGPTNRWLWRLTWHGEDGYTIGYDVTPAQRAAKIYGTQLLHTRDGKTFDVMTPDLGAGVGPTEATLRFGTDGTLWCLQRRDGRALNTALIGRSRAPYQKWEWRDLGEFFGGPNFIQLRDGRWLACGRLLVAGNAGKKEPKTVLCELDTAAAKLHPLLTLPSGGDSSYPGFVLEGDRLWISYYSSHEGKTAIYLAEVKVPDSR
jgi:hypothetical protein